MSCMLYVILGVALMSFSSYGIGRYCENNDTDMELAAVNYIAAILASVGTIIITAGILENSQIVIGTIVGCNLTLLLLFRGVSYMTRSVRREESNDFMFLFFIVVLLLFLSNDVLLGMNGKNTNLISRTDGIILLIMGIFYYFLMKRRKNTSKENRLLSENIVTLIGRLKKKYFLFLLFSIAGAIIFTKNIVPVLVEMELEQSKYGFILCGIFLTTILLFAFHIGKNVDTVEKNVDKLHTRVQKWHENVDKQEEKAIIAIGIISITILLPVSCFIHTIQISVTNIYDIIMLCAMYVLYCLFSNIPNRWDKLKGSFYITMLIGYLLFVLSYS